MEYQTTISATACSAIVLAALGLCGCRNDNPGFVWGYQFSGSAKNITGCSASRDSRDFLIAPNVEILREDGLRTVVAAHDGMIVTTLLISLEGKGARAGTESMYRTKDGTLRAWLVRERKPLFEKGRHYDPVEGNPFMRVDRDGLLAVTEGGAATGGAGRLPAYSFVGEVSAKYDSVRRISDLNIRLRSADVLPVYTEYYEYEVWRTKSLDEFEQAARYQQCLREPWKSATICGHLRWTRFETGWVRL